MLSCMTKTREQLMADRKKIDDQLRELPPAEVSDSPPAPGDTLEDRRGAEDFDIRRSNETVLFMPNHNLMARPLPTERDRRKLQKYFWYKRLTDDKIMCYTEAEAALMEKSSHKNVLRRLGTSDGSAYRKSIQSCGVKSGARIPYSQARKILQDAHEAEYNAAMGHIEVPAAQNVHIDESVLRANGGADLARSFNPAE